MDHLRSPIDPRSGRGLMLEVPVAPGVRVSGIR